MGEATVVVSPSVADFGPKTEAAVKAALAGVKANIELTLDENGLRTKITAVVKAATAGTEAKIGTDIDTDPLKNKLKTAVTEAAAEAGRGGQLDLFDVDPAKLVAEVLAAKEAARAALAAGKQLELGLDFKSEDASAKATAILDAAVAGLSGLDKEIAVHVKADDTGLGAEVEKDAKEAEAGKRIRIPVTADASGADELGAVVGGTFSRAILRTAARVLSAAGLAQLLTAADAGAVGLAGALLSAASAAGSLAGSVAVLPGLLSAAAQGAGTLLLAFGGVKGALQAFSAEQKAIGAAAASGADGIGSQARAAITSERAIRDATRGIADAQRSMADAVENATERVVTAQRSVADAQQSAADAAENATRRVADAEQNLADAHRQTQAAQESLTQARIDAANELDNLRDSVESLSLAEEDAALRVLELQDKIRQGQQGTSTHPILGEDVTKVSLADRNQAERDALNLKRAQLSLVEATKKRIDAQTALNKAEADGVDGNKKVIDATQKLEDARRNETKAIEDNTRTQREAARSIVDANQKVIDTQDALAKSQRDLGRAQEDGADRVAVAQQHLADAVQDAAMKTADGVGAAAGAINRYQAALDLLNPFTRQFVEFLVSLQPKLKELQASAASGLFPGLEQSITTLLPLLSTLGTIFHDTGQAIAGVTLEAAKLVTSPAWRSDIAELGRRNVALIQSFGRAALSLVDLLRNVALAAGPYTQHIADLVEHFSALAAKSAEVGRDNGHLEGYFQRLSARLDKVLITVGLLAHALFTVFSSATPEGDRYLGKLELIAAKFDVIVGRAKNSGALQDFFRSTEPVVASVTQLLGDLLATLVRIGQANFGKFSTFVDQIDKQLLPVLAEVLGSINTGFLTSLVDLAGALGELFHALLGANPALTVIVEFIAGMAKGVASLLTDIPLLSPVLLTLITALSAFGTVAAVIKIEELASRFSGAVAGIDLLSGAFQRFGSTAAVSAAEAKLAFETQAAAVEAAALAEEEALAAGFEATEAKAGLAATAVSAIGTALLGVAIAFGVAQVLDHFAFTVDKLVASVHNAKDPLKEFEDGVKRLNKPGFLDILAGEAHNLTGTLKILADSAVALLTGGEVGVGQLTTDVGKFLDKIKKDGPASFKAIADSSLKDGQIIIDAMEKAGISTTEYKNLLIIAAAEQKKKADIDKAAQEKVDALTDSIGGNSAALQRNIDKMRTAADQALTLSGAQINMEQAYDDLTDAVKRDSTAFDINEQSGRDAKRALDSFIGSIETTIDDLKKSADAGNLDADAKKRILDNLDRLANSGFPGAKDAANRLRTELEAIKPNYDTTVNVNTDAAQRQLNDLNGQIDSIERRRAGSTQLDSSDPTFSQPGGDFMGGIIGRALAIGGRIGRAAAGKIAGFQTSGPTLVGEGNPSFPEFVIATDPQFHDRNVDLWMRAGVRLGLLKDGLAKAAAGTVRGLDRFRLPEDVTASVGDINLMPAQANFDVKGLEASLRALEEALTEQLAATRAEVANVRTPEDAKREAVKVEIDYARLAAEFNRLGARTVTINTEVSTAVPAEVGPDTARNLQNAVYLEMGP